MDYYSGEYDPAAFWNEAGKEAAKWEAGPHPDAKAINTMMVNTQPSSVVELGCGPGRNVKFFNGARYYQGIDISRTYIDRLLGSATPKPPGLFGTVKVHDLTEPWYWLLAERFDLVFACSTLQHIRPDKIGGVIEEAVRVCKPGGYIGIIEHTEPEPHSAFYAQIHLFQHDYPRLLGEYPLDLVWRTEIEPRPQPCKREAFLWQKA